MRNRKVIYLLIILAFPVVYGIKLIIYAKSQPIAASVNLPELIRNGYDLVNDSSIFSKLCISLNDSLLLQKNNLKIAVFTDVDLSNNTIGWCLYYNEASEPLKVADRNFLYIDLYKGGHIQMQNVPVQLSDIRSLAIDYIFDPDSASRSRIFTKRTINQKEEIEVASAGVCMKVHIKENDFFSVSDWRVFYGCLRELIKLFEDERNNVSLKIWDKDFHSLLFQEKEKIVDLAGYRINIEFE